MHTHVKIQAIKCLLSNKIKSYIRGEVATSIISHNIKIEMNGSDLHLLKSNTFKNINNAPYLSFNNTLLNVTVPL